MSKGASRSMMRTLNAGRFSDVCKGWSVALTVATLSVGLSTSATAQPAFDNSGNGNLKGPYFVRQVLTLDDQNTSAITRAVSIVGTMTFDGKGGYTFSGQKVDSTAGGSATAYSVSGTYALAANGMLQLQNPIDNTDLDYGAVGAIGPSAIVASATEGPYLDVLVAIPTSSGNSVQGSFQTAFIDFLQANASQVRDGYYTLTSNGSGSFGNVSVTGSIANTSGNAATQTLSGVTYSLSNGTGTITFPTSSTPTTALVSGSKSFAVSTDGNVLVGGSPGGYDLIVGIKSLSGSASNSMYQGTYYIGALENDTSGNGNFIDSFNGSTLALGNQNTITHFRLRDYSQGAYDYTADGVTNFASNGMVNDGTFQTILGAGGQAVLQTGVSSYFSLTVSFAAAQYKGSAPFINPVDIWNAGSFAPITNSVTPGEYVSIFGTGLSTTTLAAQSLPLQTNLGGVQVMVDGVLAPLGYVSPTQINLVIPYSTPAQSFATFQVINNGATSNQVTVYTNGSAPGVFTTTANGIGPAAITHADNSLVTQSNPAKAGETLVLYVTGLGAVTPAVPDGAAAPSNPLSTTNEQIGVEIEDGNGNFYTGTVTFSGLTPGFAGLYQINFVVPSGVPSGQQWVNVFTADAYTSEAKINMQ